jgi:exodeoxyribonuclease-3
MRIVTYNVNSVNARLPNLLRWLHETAPQVVCLQELKTTQENFPHGAIRDAGYGVIWHGQKSWNGVAILARGSEPEEIRRVLPGDPDDVHSRYIEAMVNGPKFEYKLRWLNRFLAHAAELLLSGAPVVLAGDYNVIPTEADVYKPERWLDDALFRIEVREAYAHLLKHGWVDSVRAAHPGETIYTFWDYFRNAYGRNAGLRIDHLLLSPSLAGRLAGAGVDREVRGWEKASDHAPTWVDLAESANPPA